MVNGASPGPAPATQARASNSRPTRSSWRTWPHRKLRRKVPSVDGALTVTPRVQAVLPVRKASASSIQSPPARACPRESGGRRPPGSSACRRCWPGQERRPSPGADQPVHPDPGGGPRLPEALARRWLPDGDRRRRSVCGRDDYVVASKRCSFSGVGFVMKNHYPRFRGALFHACRTPLIPTPSVDSG